MTELRVGFIGTGRKKERGDTTGYFMAYRHADGFLKLDGCRLVACCDVVEENARAFAETYGIHSVYLDYREMLATEKLDVVSICTWPHLHEPMVVEACAAGVRSVFCEKPMADTWGGALRMTAAARAAGAQLCFNHLLRYGWHSEAAAAALAEGVIGEVQRYEASRGNLFDVGTHSLDLISMLNGEQRAKWVLAQIDYRQENLFFGAHCENQHVVFLEYESGAYGLVVTTPDGRNPVGGVISVIGNEGALELQPAGGPPVRWRRWGDDDWTVPEAPEGASLAPQDRCLKDVLECLATGRTCRVDASHALLATEIIFAAYESSRRRGRVDLPLEVEDNALRSMVEAGDLTPAPR